MNGAKKTPPPEQTHAENFYYQKQMQTKTPMVLVLQDGEEIHGVIEWYDKYCLKVNRTGATNLLIYKPSIKYMYQGKRSRAAEVEAVFSCQLSVVRLSNDRPKVCHPDR